MIKNAKLNVPSNKQCMREGKKSTDYLTMATEPPLDLLSAIINAPKDQQFSKDVIAQAVEWASFLMPYKY